MKSRNSTTYELDLALMSNEFSKRVFEKSKKVECGIPKKPNSARIVHSSPLRKIKNFTKISNNNDSYNISNYASDLNIPQINFSLSFFTDNNMIKTMDSYPREPFKTNFTVSQALIAEDIFLDPEIKKMFLIKHDSPDKRSQRARRKAVSNINSSKNTYRSSLKSSSLFNNSLKSLDYNNSVFINTNCTSEPDRSTSRGKESPIKGLTFRRKDIHQTNFLNNLSVEINKF